MNKTLKLYVLFLVLLLVVIVYVDANRPKPINWIPTYDLNDKIPLGLYIFDQEASTLFKNDSIVKTPVTAYEYFDTDYEYSDSSGTLYYTNGTFFSVSEYYNIDEESTQELLYFAERGNSVFISTKNFSQKLQDSLKFELKSEMPTEKGLSLSLANSKLGKANYNFNEGAGNTFFSKIDTLSTEVLGYQMSDTTQNVNFIKVPYKSGFFYLHTQPAAFTNFHLLKENHHHYTEKIVSYIPRGQITWLIKGQTGESISQSRLRFILHQPALKYAWFLFLAGMVFFMVFNAKRKQRIVPIVKPLTNTTVDFTKTIGNLYFQEGDHQNIIDKKIIYFLEKIRNEYLIETTTLDDNFIKRLQLKSGKNIEDIQTVVHLINYQKKSYHQSVEEDLIALNKAIEKIIS